MKNTLTKIGSKYVLKQGDQKLISTEDAFMIVEYIRTKGLTVSGLELLPVYYRSMLPVTYLTESEAAHVLQLTPNTLT